jgi:iron complex outermembrane receptor protein
MSPETCPKQTGTLRVGNLADVDSSSVFQPHQILLVTRILLARGCALQRGKLMKKTILAASVAAALSLTQTTAFAEDDSMVVTASRFSQEAIKSPSHISIITQQQVNDSGVQNVTELLRSHGGIQITDTFGDGNLTIVSMRGMGETGVSNVLIIVDGRKLNNPDISAPDLNSISLDNIERIEIIQGSAGTLYGDQAVAGVINIITKIPSKRHLHVAAGMGSYDKENYAFSYSDTFDNGFSLRFSADDSQSDGYRDDNDKERTQYFGRVDYTHDSGNIFVEYQEVENSFLSRAALSNAQVNSDRKQAAGFILFDGTTSTRRAGIEQKISKNWTLLAELTDRDFDNESPSQSISFGTSLTTTQRNVTSLTPRVVGVVPMSEGKALITVGADIEDENYVINNTSVGGFFGASDFNNKQERQIYSGYARASIPLQKQTTLTVGSRYSEINAEFTGAANSFFGSSNLDSDFDDNVTVFEIGLIHMLSQNLKAYIRRDENFRFAKTNELADVFNGLTSLDTQEGVSIETGVEWTDKKYSLALNVFQLDIKDEIGAITDSFGSVFNINFDDTRRRGLNIEGQAKLSDSFDIGGQYSYVNAEFTQGAFNNNDIPFAANHQASIFGTFKPNKNLQLFAEALYTGSKYSIGDFDNTLGKRGGYTVFNAAASYIINAFTVTARINNILDKKYNENTVNTLDFSSFPYNETLAFSPSPERNFTLSVAYDLK